MNQFSILWGYAILSGFLIVLFIISVMNRKRPVYPALKKEDILFQESFASGRSIRNAATAGNCMSLKVTREELRTTLSGPFKFIAFVGDMEHSIPLSSIIYLHEKKRFISGRYVLLEFQDRYGATIQMELKPHQMDKFLKIMHDLLPADIQNFRTLTKQ